MVLLELTWDQRVVESRDWTAMNGHCSGRGVFGDLEGEGKSLAIREESLRRLIHIEEHPNGGASVVHLYQEEIDRLLPREQIKALADIFFR